jgi:hypothetical protein
MERTKVRTKRHYNASAHAEKTESIDERIMEEKSQEMEDI